VSACWLQAGRQAFGLMLGLRRLLCPGVAGLVAAVAVEATRRLATLLAEEGGVQFPAALRAAGEADSGHGPSLLRHIGKPQPPLDRYCSLLEIKGNSRAAPSLGGTHPCEQPILSRDAVAFGLPTGTHRGSGAGMGRDLSRRPTTSVIGRHQGGWRRDFLFFRLSRTTRHASPSPARGRVGLIPRHAAGRPVDGRAGLTGQPQPGCTWVRWGQVCGTHRPVCGFGPPPCGVGSGPQPGRTAN
jgi:hypothetical protein